MSLAFQDLLVSLIAFGAFCTVAWRLIQIVGPSEATATCSKCPSCPSPAHLPPASSTEAGRAKVIWLSDTAPPAR